MTRGNRKKEEKKKVIDNYGLSEEPNREQKDWYNRKMNDFYRECYICDQCGQLHKPIDLESYDTISDHVKFFDTFQSVSDKNTEKRQRLEKIWVTI